MKKIIYSLFIFLFIFQGCATPSYMTSREGTIKVGMTKSEVLAVWGEPELKHFFELDSRTFDRWELWRYPRKTWWAAHGVDLAFNKDGVLTSIEPLIK
jgi:outer membrane protein assembly factor BamE (lipoprotein component of BamABCDE complex)